jgi:hypothetical protein
VGLLAPAQKSTDGRWYSKIRRLQIAQISDLLRKVFFSKKAPSGLLGDHPTIFHAFCL